MRIVQWENFVIKYNKSTDRQPPPPSPAWNKGSKQCRLLGYDYSRQHTKRISHSKYNHKQQSSLILKIILFTCLDLGKHDAKKGEYWTYIWYTGPLYPKERGRPPNSGYMRHARNPSLRDSASHVFLNSIFSAHSTFFHLNIIDVKYVHWTRKRLLMSLQWKMTHRHHMPWR